METYANTSFGALLRRYRKFSGFITLTQLSKEMERYELFYEQSLICKWETNVRKIKNRDILIKLIKLFCDRGVLVYIEQAQEFAQAAGFGYLTDTEITTIADLRWIDNQKNVFTFNPQITSGSTAILDFLADKSVDSIHADIEDRLPEILTYMQSCWKIGNCDLVTQLWQKIGPYLWNSGRWDDMRKYGMYAYHCAKNCGDDASVASVCLRDLCWLYFWQGDLDSAIKFHRDGTAAAHKLKDSKLVALSNLRAGKISQAKEEHRDSIKCFKLSCNYYRSKDDSKLGDLFTYIGESYWLMGDQQQARSYFSNALKIVIKNKDIPQQAIIYTRLGGLCLNRKQFKDAENYFIMSMELENLFQRRAGGNFWNNLGLGMVSYGLGRESQKDEYFRQASFEQAHLGLNSRLGKISPFLSALKKELADSGYFL